MIVHFLTRESAPMRANIERLMAACRAAGNETQLFFHFRDLQPGELLFILAYDRILPPESLAKHKHNIVIHASDLPAGKGFSPMSWSIAEGRDKIVFTLFDAVEDVDAGQVYARKELQLAGNELYAEWKQLQADVQEEMVMEFLDTYPNLHAQQQAGESSYYRKRNRSDDQLHLDRSLREAFNTIRVCDPEAFPAWFEHGGRKFKVIVSPLDE